jgi:hypothetical protein
VGTVVHAFHLSFIGSRNREDYSSRPAQIKKKKVCETPSQQQKKTGVVVLTYHPIPATEESIN